MLGKGGVLLLQVLLQVLLYRYFVHSLHVWPAPRANSESALPCPCRYLTTPSLVLRKGGHDMRCTLGFRTAVRQQVPAPAQLTPILAFCTDLAFCAYICMRTCA